MSSSLTRLIIAHLRGSVGSFELPFERGKKLTVIYGENATGKSTICDALEFLSKGKVGSLDNRGLGRTSKYWNTVSKTTADVTVTLETVGVSCRATVVKGDVVVYPPEVRPQVEVLRRGQILALLEAQPADRYAAISRFIDVSGVEASEKALRNQIRDLNKSRDIAAARILENQEAIQQFWEAAGRPRASAMAWADAEAKRDPRATDPELVALRSLQDAYSRLAVYPDRALEVVQTVQKAGVAAEDAQQQADQYLHRIARDAGEMVRLLTAAQAYLRKYPDSNVCPLCERADAAEDLSERLAQRLDAFTAFQHVQAQKQQADAGVQRAEHERDLLRKDVARDVAAFNRNRAGFGWSTGIPLPMTPAPHEIEALVSWLAATADLPKQWKQAEVERQNQGQFLATLKKALQTYAENMRGQQELDILLPNLRRALEIVEEERKTFSDNILRLIASEVGRMYEAVHPGEGLEKINLELDAARRASLDIGASFGGLVGTPPQAYFSQSHLDTLGLCVFLALAMLDDPANTILVLDDVVASVDEPHVDRLIHMLYDEAPKFRHCIITTHYGPWKHKLRWGWLQNGECQFVELSRWTMTDGMAINRSVPDVERLKRLLADSSPDPQLVVAKAGVILEAALDFLTQLYECSIPRRQEARYTLGELLPAINKKLRSVLRVEVLSITDATGTRSYESIQLGPILDDLMRIAQTRNVVGCHFNRIAFDLLDTDAFVFGQKVLELIEALADVDAGWPRNDKSGMYWANRGETRRLHPLKQPS